MSNPIAWLTWAIGKLTIIVIAQENLTKLGMMMIIIAAAATA